MKKLCALMLTSILAMLCIVPTGVTAEEVSGGQWAGSAIGSSIQQVDISVGKSERHRMYDQLLEANYLGGEMIAKFQAIFGDYSPQYIREHYAEIFDIAADEIDEGFLNIIASEERDADAGGNWLRSIRLTKGAAFDNYRALIDAPESVIPEPINSVAPSLIVMQQADDETLVSDNAGSTNNDEQTADFAGNVVADHDATKSSAEGSAESEILKVDQLSDEEFSMVLDSKESERADAISTGTDSMSAMATSSSLNSITLVSVANTTVIFDVWYANSNDINNILQMYDTINGSWSYLLGRENKPAGTAQRYIASGLIAGGVYTFKASTYDFSSASWKESEVKVQTTGAKTAALTLVSTNTISFTVKATFPVEGSWGNILQYHNGIEWINLTPSDYKGVSGNYAITNIIPGKSYRIIMKNYDHMTGTWKPEIVLTSAANLPAENLITYQKSNIDFKLDSWFANMFTSGRLTRFLDKTNAAYNTVHNFVGGNLQVSGKQGFETSRTMSVNAEGMSGQPITWSIYNTVFNVAPDHVLRMNQLNTDITEAPIHEIGHNFQSYRWNFDGESLTCFQVYQYMATTNETMAVGNVDTPIVGGKGFQTYMKSQANRILGHINYDAAIAQNAFSPYSLAYTFSVISDKIGFEPFEKTFRFFNDLSSDDVPLTNQDKLNLFFTKLRDYSGVDVLSTTYIPANARVIYEKQFGKIAYVTASGITDGDIYSLRNTNLKYLSVSPSSSSSLSSYASPIFSAVTILSTTNGNELWRLTSVGGDMYSFESLGVRGSNYGANANMLAATGTPLAVSGSLKMADFAAASTQRWYIEKLRTRNYIVNSAYPRLMAVILSGGTVSLSTDSSGAGWSLERYETQNSSWGGRYDTSVNSGPISLSIYIDAGIITNKSPWDIYTAASAWNGITSNATVSVYRQSNYPVSAASTIDVFAFEHDFGSTSTTLGQMVPDGSGLVTINSNNWSYVDIWLSPAALSLSPEDQKMNFMHEVGHALKLRHPHEVSTGWRPLSIMNQGLPKSLFDIPCSPQGNDKYNLSKKWK